MNYSQFTPRILRMNQKLKKMDGEKTKWWTICHRKESIKNIENEAKYEKHKVIEILS
jgi:hypothetical protein